MPIVDIELVREPRAASAGASTRALADALGHAFDSAPGHTWVRLRTLDAQVLAITRAVAQCLACAPERVHVLYAPPGAGRQAFGGTLIR